MTIELMINRCITDSHYREYVLMCNINANIEFHNALLCAIGHNSNHANINGFDYTVSELQTNIQYNINIINRIMDLI